jgi:hypothetical protein
MTQFLQFHPMLSTVSLLLSENLLTLRVPSRVAVTSLDPQSINSGAHTYLSCKPTGSLSSVLDADTIACATSTSTSQN